jgi:hypothetical protein
MDAPVPLIALVLARGAGARLDGTLAALERTLPGARIELALPSGGPGGRGRDATLAARRILDAVLVPAPPLVLLCPGDAGPEAGELVALVAAVRRDECDVALARGQSADRGPAAGLARVALARLAGRRAPGAVRGAVAVRGSALPVIVPFADGEALELGLAVDALRAGLRVAEIEVDVPPAARRGLAAEARAVADVGAAALRRG